MDGVRGNVVLILLLEFLPVDLRMTSGERARCEGQRRSYHFTCHEKIVGFTASGVDSGETALAENVRHIVVLGGEEQRSSDDHFLLHAREEHFRRKCIVSRGLIRRADDVHLERTREDLR